MSEKKFSWVTSVVYVLITLVLMFSMATCGKETSGSSYEGTVDGFDGPITIKISVTDGKITGGEFVLISEAVFAIPAADTILEQAIKNGNADNLDVVSGSTITSNATIAAIQAALAASSGMSTKDEVPAEDISTDIVIIGAGGAGLSAAIAARNGDVSVIVLEKMGIAGGNTNYATGGLNASETSSQTANNIADSNQQFYDDTMKGGNNVNNPDLVRVMVENSAQTVDWLIGLGMDLSDVGKLGGSTNNRTHRPTGGGAIGSHFTAIMVKAAEDSGAEIRYNSTVTSIIDKDRKVTGVTVSSPNGDYTITAKAVIVATGGFGANAELVSSFVPSLEGFGTTNHRGATGDAIELVQAFDVALVDIEQIQTHPTVVPVKNIMITEAVRGNGAIMTNLEGKRFEQEMATRDVMSEAILAQTGKTAYLVFDQGIRDSLKAIEAYQRQGLLTEGATLAELAQNLNMPVANLEATVASYNSSVDSETDADFGRADMPRKIETGPFFAVEVAPAIHHTMGGLKIHTETEVLNTSNTVVPGLYAAGEVTGGIHGTNRLGGNALSDIATFGRIAGTEAALYVK